MRGNQRAAEMGVTMDLQLEVEGHVINAHRCILAARSEWFAAALSSRMKEAHTGLLLSRLFTKFPHIDKQHPQELFGLLVLLLYIM